MSSIQDNNPLEAADRCDSDSLRIETIIDPSIEGLIDTDELARAAAAAARFAGLSRGEIGIRVTDDAEIQRINREHLGHDDATDVISFGYRLEPPLVEGELVVSAEMATRRAAELKWQAERELILYVVHGTLHLAGMDDQQPGPRAEMRQAEQQIMLRLGIDDIAQFAADRVAADRVAADRVAPTASPAPSTAEGHS